VSSTSSPKKLKRQLYFSRAELSAILCAYSARVAAGEWRDYALDYQNGVAMFSIFRHTHETPLFVIEKWQKHPKQTAQFVLRGRNRIQFKSGQLGDLLSHFSKVPRLVSG
tara:strand:+ start:52 stop:381 length:330 start_codon:yes stop_codon:yes gene_type:complete